LFVSIKICVKELSKKAFLSYPPIKIDMQQNLQGDAVHNCHTY
jgi:hypothetical protein